MTEIPKKYRKIRDRAVNGHSKSAAIHLFCLRCCGWKRQEVRNCPDKNCFLFSYRPYSVSPSPKKQDIVSETATITPCPIQRHPPTPEKPTEPIAKPESIPAPAVRPKTRKVQTPEQKFDSTIKRLSQQTPSEVFESCLTNLCAGRNK